ncbi:MAG: glutamine amidotransferase [Hyphomicrobiales bacterium]|nr:glutamine amidotransferase [Hyphomicrobiales bacterium]
MRPLPILVILHKRCSSTGRIGRALAAKGYPLDIRLPRFGDPLPPTLAGHSGAIVFGGPMSANDPDDYIRREIDWLRTPLIENKPFLGVCLGGQMLAKHLGGVVRPHEEALVEVGYQRIRPTEAGVAMPSRVYHWHREGFSLPRGATLLARGDVFENQAFRYGSAVAVQFHPEITLGMIHRWTAQSLHKFSGPHVQQRTAQIARHLLQAPRQQKWLSDFLSSWLQGVSADIASRTG